MLQEKFCNRACVGRFLRIKGDNVKKAAKQLRSCLSWRSSLGIGTFSLLIITHSQSLYTVYLYTSLKCICMYIWINVYIFTVFIFQDMYTNILVC